MKKICIIVGTRPNFIKVTQFKKVAIKIPGISVNIIHTGQHYDSKMADVFFEQFNLKPDYFLNTPPGSANSQMANIMLELEKSIEQIQPSVILVVGDVNSTLAGALTANKAGIKLAHIESGLRSNDRTMPEEINRILTDELSDYFFVTEQSGYDNLIKEGKKKGNIFLVGNTMIDTLIAFEKQVNESLILLQLELELEKYVLMTMHRPATVDSKEGLMKLIELMELISEKYKIVFPIHPRTIKRAEEFDLAERLRAIKGLILTDPLDYFAFQKLIAECKFILTDSGGIQEESTFRKKPCLTLRPNTERPSTVDLGTNTLVPFDLKTIQKYISQIEEGIYKKGKIPPFWDGKSTERIMEIIADKIN
ncbi:MAG: UDP-N-acetylglucosamine 2-epimerase (non-hydrolyzing) [Bacteroidota bacterium]|nr:UDP-N-acetylglucosamine 2-epimerase (non-hydrolyzing) [Bacteroidota bacterium]